MRKLIFFFIIIKYTFIFAENHNTIPPSHWVYQSIDRLQIAGYLSDLDYGDRPYSRKTVAIQIKKIQLEKIKSSQLKIELLRLKKEFTSDINSLNKTYSNMFTIGAIGNSIYNIEDNRFNYSLNPKFGLSFNKNIFIKYSGLFDKEMILDPYYIGREYFNIAGYQEQMYIAYSHSGFTIKYGRDYVKFGYGKRGNLLISDNSRSFDMLDIKIKSKTFTFHSLLSQLDYIENAVRYLTASRLEIRFPYNLVLGIGHGALYGGINREFDYTLSNPISLSYAAAHNDQKNVNAMLYMDIMWRLYNKYKLYAEILIDDYQFEQEVIGDLEPNEIGFTFGLETLDILWGFSGWAEFTQVRNRTYNVNNGKPFEKYLHRNQFIGHSLGTDFQSFQIETEKWFNQSIKSGIGYYLIRKGIGTVRGDFSEPYMDDNITMKTGYKEKIPYGIVETTNRLYYNVHYEYNTDIQIDLTLGYQIINNINNEKNKSLNEICGSLSLFINFRKNFIFK